MKQTVLRFFLGFCLTLVLVGVMAYLQTAFQKADVRTAVRLVEEAQVSGKPLLWSMDRAIPRERRSCEVEIVSKFYGHAKVSCRDTVNELNELRWSVNVVDGMVKPDNESAIKLGKGEMPWKL